ncbi:hypothetical protein BG30_04305 [Bacillus subtilis subsp. subtilis]|nr:hypothetical protein BG30_04305 [Bacillus subtilis subsp. subtilis]
MYKGYNLSLNDVDFVEFYSSGKSYLENFKKNVEEELDKYINEEGDGSISGTQLQGNWFPEIDAHIFLSHSHADLDKAIALAGWLKQSFGLKTFIDSCVWGYADDLLKKLDNKYCRQDDGFYNYELRNHSTSHVHMMLSTALIKMIDKTECVMFLNTPNSIESKNVVQQTSSPWIFLELAMTDLIRKSKPDRPEKKFFAEKSMTVYYDAPTEHLDNLVKRDLESWLYNFKRYPMDNALDNLYYMKNLMKNLIKND